jgi:hypothetical protein
MGSTGISPGSFGGNRSVEGFGGTGGNGGVGGNGGNGGNGGSLGAEPPTPGEPVLFPESFTIPLELGGSTGPTGPDDPSAPKFTG